HYLKTYLPYLPLLLIVTIGLAINSVFLTPARVLGDQTNITVDGLFADTNQQRTSDSETALNLNDQLNSAAQAKANDMVTRDYWSHNTPDGQQPWTFITAAGYTYTAAGENLAYGFDSSDAVITGWMNSAEHRANILSTSYKDVGFGIASSPNFVGTGPETVVVAMYGAQQDTNSVNISFSVGSKPSSPSPVATETPAPTPVAPTSPTPDTSTPAPAPTASSTPTVAHSATQLSTTRNISRIQLLAQDEAWSTLAVTLIGLGTIAIFLTRHVRFWHRAIRKGEMFVIRHLWFDALIVSIATGCYIVSRVAGVIG
ncbi:MAG TPA: CAP domain-containing protein, partial [Candidatus Saccharimonadales bacterium]|nr:CAP domain-containing protein [Candidatus Saccharimonadales bacterium]